MTAIRSGIVVVILWSGLEVAHFACHRVAVAGGAGVRDPEAKELVRVVAAKDHGDEAKERARIVVSQPLAKLDGDHLKVTLVEVNYGPGEASMPHSHPCPVIAYVAEGAILSQVKGGAEKVYKAGESFYEPANGVHQVSANASKTEPAKLLAYFVCDRDVPLSVDVAQGNKQGGSSR
jgi:quercetin dioxygenase-like cupin family protein